MANYKRVISYMYAYRNQLKGNNVGFARIETRGNECKITIHVRIANMKDQEIGSYMYCWNNGQMHAVYLGDIHISSNVGELVVKTDVDNVMNSRYRFTEMGGILLYVSDSLYIATEWDGKAVIFDSLKIDTVKPEASGAKNKEQEEIEQPLSHEAESLKSKEEAPAAKTIRKEPVTEKVEENGAKVEAAAAAAVQEEEKQSVGEEPEEAILQSIDEVAGPEAEEEKAVEETPIPLHQEEVECADTDSKEQSDGFPITREKMEHLDKQAQELFGTMLLNTLFPPEKSAEKKKEDASAQPFDPLSEEGPGIGSDVRPQSVPKEEEEAVEQAEASGLQKEADNKPKEVAASGSISINPKSAIECFTAFRDCESKEEYDEIQEEIGTLKAEVKHLERITKEWKIKEARMNEIRQEKEEANRESKKQEIEHKIREEYKIDGINSELTAAEIKRALTERIFNKYPKMEPFDETSVERCVRIEPQDLGILPMENWILANNSFLLHGYYSYRHLIFLMEKQGEQERYLLGVPGVNHSRESFMANMFGFSIFKKLAASENASGEFGYWCQEIIM